MTRTASLRLSCLSAVALAALVGIPHQGHAQERVLSWASKAQPAPTPVMPPAPAPTFQPAPAPVFTPTPAPAPYYAAAPYAPAPQFTAHPPAPRAGLMATLEPGAAFAAPASTPIAAPSYASQAGVPRPGDQVAITFFRAGQEQVANYTLRRGDVISVRVQDVPELDAASVQVLPDGSVPLPLIGALPVAGQNVGAIIADLEARYTALRVRDPRVTVLVNATNDRAADFLEALANGPNGPTITITVPRSGTVILPLVGDFNPFQPLSAWRAALDQASGFQFGGAVGALVNYTARVDERIYVIGEVNQPGAVELQDADTAFSAIASAGGLLKTAARNRVLILRTQPNGARNLMQLDFTDVLVGRGAAGATDLLPGDIVIAPPSRIAQTGTAIEQYVRNLLPFTIGVGVGLEFQQ